jgi:hypothetical protein
MQASRRHQLDHVLGLVQMASAHIGFQVKEGIHQDSVYLSVIFQISPPISIKIASRIANRDRDQGWINFLS